MTRPQIAVLRAAVVFVLEQWEANRGDPLRLGVIDGLMRKDAGARWHDTLRRIGGDLSRELATRDYAATKRAGGARGRQ